MTRDTAFRLLGRAECQLEEAKAKLASLGEMARRGAFVTGTFDAKADVERLQTLVDDRRKTAESLEDPATVLLRSALREALDNWESLWTSDNNDDPPPRIAELRKLLT